MSKYIPFAAQVREYEQQIKRRAYGLKNGTYVNYPDPEKGPYIVLAKKAEAMRAIETEVIAENTELLEKLED